MLNDYRKNKLFYITTSSLITGTPLIIAYGLFYEKYLRKIPFHIQLGLIILVYKGNLKLIQEFIYLYEKISKEIEKD